MWSLLECLESAVTHNYNRQKQIEQSYAELSVGNNTQR